jgi:hypothetical protein
MNSPQRRTRHAHPASRSTGCFLLRFPPLRFCVSISHASRSLLAPLAALTFAAVLCVLPACHVRLGGGKSADAVANQLREEKAQLATQLDAAQGRIKELEALAGNRAPMLSADAIAALPVASSLTIDPWSGLDTRAGREPEIIIYLTLKDGRDRVMQGVGSLLVRVESSDASLVLEQSLTPPQLRDAFRSGPLGTHYRVAWPWPSGAGLAPPALHVDATFTDAITGAQLRVTRDLAPPAGTPPPSPVR